MKHFIFSLGFSSILSLVAFYWLKIDFPTISSPLFYGGIICSVFLVFLYMNFAKKFLFPRFLKTQKNNLDQLSQIYYQKDRDSWNKVKQFVELNLCQHQVNLSFKDLKKELNDINLAYKNSRTTVRMKLDELDSMNFSASKNS